jgi:1,2-diacylglycerol 3-beta-glucosyltransferase
VGGVRLLQSISFVMIVLFLSYITSILVPFVRRKPDRRADPGAFDWHFFIPCRAEAAVIGATLARCRADFPDVHVWVVDDDSEDATATIVAAAAAEDPHVHLVQRRLPDARTGKGDALNDAYRALNRFLPAAADRTRVIVNVVDADGEMDPKCLEYMAAPAVFADPAVGAAQASVCMKNRDDPDPRPGEAWYLGFLARWMIRMQDLEFRTTIAAMQALRSRTHSVGLGGNGQFTRLSVLDEIAERFDAPWHGALLEDYELGVHVLLAGYANRYVHDTFVAQEALPYVKRFVTQRTRWAQGNIQCVRYLPELFRSPHLTNAAMIESSYYLVLPYAQLVGTLIWPIITAALLLQITQPDVGLAAYFIGQVWLLPLLFVFSILPFVIWGPLYRRREVPEASWVRGWIWGFGNWLYVYYMYFCVWRAFIRVVLGRSGWAKTRRNAEPLTVGPVATEA